MAEFLTNAGSVAAAILSILGVGGTAYTWIKKPWRAVRTAMAKVDTMAAALGDNGGTTLADEIRRQGKVLDQQGIELRRTGARLSALSDIDGRPIFETDEHGAWTRINRAFEFTFGFSVRETVGYGWVILLAPSEREAVITEWKHAVRDQRVFLCECHLSTRAGLAVMATIRAHPTTGREGERVIGWFGVIEITSVQTAGAH